MNQRGCAAAAIVVAAVLAVLASSADAARSAAKPRVTFVGDSISASLDYVPAARNILSRRFRMQYDLEVCRRLVTTSCSFQGRTPTTALEAVRSRGRSLGDVLIVHVGYNEGSAGYGAGMRQVIRAARAQGAKGVVWVTLRETRDIYRATNVAIREEAARWPQVVVADWNAASRGRPYFREDGLHLDSAGAVALARLVRESVLRVA
jgi:hypothetical protein